MRIPGAYILSLSLLLPCAPLFAQQTAPGKSAPQTAPGKAVRQSTPAKAAGFKLFFEKVYLHVDRSDYHSGDNIWFKAYLVNAQSNHPTASSDNLYVELIDPNEKIVSRVVIRLDQGMGVGDFKLDDSIPGGRYRLRAYTNWMRNFGNHFIFEKTLHIYSDIAQVSLPPAPASNVIQFFPESGSLIAGLPAVMAFKATDPKGRGIAVKGTLLSSKGDTILHFQTTFKGMGSFSYTPAPGLHYKALLQYPAGRTVSQSLPEASTDGYTMHLIPEDTLLTVEVRADPAHSHETLTLAGRHGGKLYYGDTMALANGMATKRIAKNIFPPGIACLTLYDTAMHPYAERLAYISSRDSVIVTVTTDKPVYRPREKVTIQIQATDARAHPVRANLSMAVVDRGIIGADPGNIRSYLELSSELRGRIEDPVAYFDPSNSHRAEQLDLLLRTQGWRNFVWRSLADSAIRISYLPEPGITISGRVRETFLNKPLPKMNITLYVPGNKGDRYLVTETDSTGHFFVDGLNLYGMQTVRVSSKNNKGKGGGWLLLDTVFNNPVAASQVPYVLLDTAATLGRYSAEAEKRFKESQKETFSKVLPGVTVTSRSKPVTLRDGSAYLDFGYPAYDFTIAPRDLVYETLANFLVHNVPGAVEDVAHDGVEFIVDGKPARPRFIVDKKEDIFERIDYYTVHMDQVNSVSVRHLVGPPSFSKTQGGRPDQGLATRDIFLVYLSLKPGAYNNNPSRISAEIGGYYEARNFYAPAHPEPDDDARPDVRTTLYWEPYVTTDADGKATVTFYNADPATTIDIEVEGLTDDGIPLTGTTNYELRK